ncbi:ATP-binding protein [uncultured Desulfobacter sp.]|uniref:sensor histidine kinase n=1 Tax=uncultured Desulfobacter sp. TaxID=240139 RepID=UPI002AA601D6|nr:ATP-binding protein [uncultured Desulfobacter sp.]
MKIKLKIALLFMLLSILPISIISTIVFIEGKKIIEQKAIDHLVTTNDLKLDTLIHWAQSRSRFLNSIGTVPLLSLSQPAEFNRTTTFPSATRAFLNAFVGEHQFLELFLVNITNGRIMVSTNPIQEGKFKDDQAFFKQGKTAPFIQDIVFDIASERPMMIFSVPLLSETGRTWALLAGTADLKGLSEIFEKKTQLSTTEDTYLINQFNYFITEPRFGKEYALKKSVSTLGTQQARTAGQFIGLYKDYRGIEVLGETRWLEKRRLFLVSEIDQAEVDASIFTLKNKVLVTASIIVAIAAFAGWLFTGLVTHPLTALTKATREVGDGQFQIDLDISRRGELYDLARAFKTMADRLKATMVSKTELEKEIVVRKAAERQLQETVNALEQSNEDLQQFAYVASHDLQEPLRMVSSFTQLLADRYTDQLDEKAHKWINFAVDGATRMQRLIQDLLSFSRVNTRGGEFEETALEDVIDEIKRNLQLPLNKTSARIEIVGLPIIRADRNQMVMLFQNLVANAVKFCKDKPPVIRISSEEQDNHWLIHVQDNGIGIEPAFINQIFIIFKRLHTREEYPGTGLGLAVCKRIVQRHNGWIWAESEPGKGTIFHIALPT